MSTNFEDIPVQAYPKPVTQCWTTSDGRLHAGEEAARAHEASIARLKRRERLADHIMLAIRDSSRHQFGELKATDDRFATALASRLAADGMDFIDGRDP